MLPMIENFILDSVREQSLTKEQEAELREQDIIEDAANNSA
jgi:hypothetical protein